MLPPGDMDVLVQMAGEAATRALAPYSGFKVGAALLARDGSSFTGCNIENPSLTLCVCAERVALLKALSEGYRSFKALAVVSADGGPCFPCGSCRQMLVEFAPDITLYLKSEEGVREILIDELLPHPFKR
jgi:homotetrameric cytidine deaminase